MFEGEAFGRYGHSTGCVTLSDGTVVVSVFGGYMKIGLFAMDISNPRFFQWSKSLLLSFQEDSSMCNANVQIPVIQHCYVLG